MTNRMPGFEQENANIDPITTGMFYVRPVTTSVGAGLGMDDNIASANTDRFSGADTKTKANILRFDSCRKRHSCWATNSYRYEQSNS